MNNSRNSSMVAKFLQILSYLKSSNICEKKSYFFKWVKQLYSCLFCRYGLATGPAKYLSSLALNWFIELACTTSCGRLFQCVTILLVKKCSLWLQVVLDCFDNLKLCPRVLFAGPSKIWEVGFTSQKRSILLNPFLILNKRMRSPLILLSTSFVSPSIRKRSSYGRFLIWATTLVALLWTFSRTLMSCFEYGDQTGVYVKK